MIFKHFSDADILDSSHEVALAACHKNSLKISYRVNKGTKPIPESMFKVLLNYISLAGDKVLTGVRQISILINFISAIGHLPDT